MKRLVILTATAVLTLAAGASAQTAPATCNNQSLTGSYGFVINGTRPAPSVLPNSLFVPGTIEQVIGVVLHVFDGNGNFTQKNYVKGSLSGPFLGLTGGGTYTVNPDCTGTFTVINKVVPFPLVNSFILVDGGQEIRSVVVSPQGAMVVANGRKVN
jgi:hypothetical protein